MRVCGAAPSAAMLPGMACASRIVAAVAALTVLLPAAPASSGQNALSVAALAQRTHFHGLAVDPSDPSRLLLATHHGLYAVEADGSARLISERADDFMGFSPHPSDGVTLYSSGHPTTGGNLGFMLSTDGGRSWTQLSEGATGIADFHAMAVSAADPNTIYGTYGGLQVSRDGGRSWEMVGPGPEGVIDLAASALDADLIYAGTRIGLLRSRDGGESWEPAHPSDAPAPLVTVGTDGAVYAFLVGEGLMRAREPELAWEAIGDGLDGRVPIHLALDPNDPKRLHAIAVRPDGHDPVILASRDAGESWTPFGAAP